MASTYPGALDSLDTTWSNTDATDTVHPQHHTDLADAVNKIELELGTDPSAAFVDVKTRLNQITTVRKTASQNMAGTTAVNITDLAFALPAAAGAFFTMDFTVIYSTNSAASGVGFSHTFPTLGTSGYCSALVTIGAIAADGATTEPWVGSITGATGADVVISPTTVATATNYIATVRCVLYTGTTANTAGSYQLQGRSETTAAITIMPGSHGLMWTG